MISNSNTHHFPTKDLSFLSSSKIALKRYNCVGECVRQVKGLLRVIGDVPISAYVCACVCVCMCVRTRVCGMCEYVRVHVSDLWSCVVCAGA